MTDTPKAKRRFGCLHVLLLPKAWLGGIKNVDLVGVRKDGAFELRAYAPRVVAETTVDASLEDAGNQRRNEVLVPVAVQNELDKSRSP